jgi:aspartyl protease family protein
MRKINPAPANTQHLGGIFLIVGFISFIIMLSYLLHYNLYAPIKPKIIIQENMQRMIVLTRQDNHFYVVGSLNGVPLNLIVDTGATTLTISQDFANQLQLKPTAKIMAQTANGNILAGVANLETLELHGIVLTNIKVIIVPNMLEDAGLLGNNVLKHFQLTQDATQMTLTIKNHDENN